MDTKNQEVFLPILIVEDEEDYARSIKKALKESGYIMNHVYHVENGQDAIDFLKKQGNFKNSDHRLHSLILLDVKLPMKNGFEVLEEIKSDGKINRIPVVMLTTSSTNKDIEKALSLGANDYIVKPIKFRDLSNKLSNLGYYWGLISDVKKSFNE